MTAEIVRRRLAAILTADVVGYSRLMEADEAGTWSDFKPVAAGWYCLLSRLMADGLLIWWGMRC
ncbi:hypothetical protein AJ88_07925 [Mesorhizobium amorphae CCBAU 01583]|nr:hypothetical protein AJ88_07925 [Mesorhizobium amorphae CCBAU 01583]